MEPAQKIEKLASSQKLTNCFVDAYAFFNKELFDNELPSDIIFTFVRKYNGYFSHDTWRDIDSDQILSEISINPERMARVDTKIIFSTLAHEMCHLWQKLFGKPSKNKYHNKEFSSKMEEIGLMTSKTGKPGGKRTGTPMSHFIIEDGKFDKAFDKIKNVKIPFVGIPFIKKKAKGYSKFVCPQCAAVLRGNQNLSISCIPCSKVQGEIVEFEIE